MLAAVSALLGLAVGSFLNSYIWRLLYGGSVWRGRSYCPQCKKTLRWYELVPVLSFALQLGRCRGCKQKIDWQYPAVELATALLFVANYKLGIRNQGIIHDSLFLIRQLVSWYLLAVLVILFVYDLRYGLVPDRVVLPAIAIVFLYKLFSVSPESENSLLLTTYYLLLAIVIGGGFFALQYFLSRGRWVGAGDIRLGALAGAILGWPLLLPGLFITYVVGGMVGAGLLIAGRKRLGQTLPLGTFLTFGTTLTMLYGDQLLNWYFNRL